jgi:uncharacterized phage infection (PIP) family protein YhgE
MKQITELRKTYSDQLQKTVTEIGQLSREIEMLQQKKEQLKGAIFSLDTLSNSITKANAAPDQAIEKEDVAQTEEKKEEATDGKESA